MFHVFPLFEFSLDTIPDFEVQVKVGAKEPGIFFAVAGLSALWIPPFPFACVEI